jgi:uncharacterized delta-60 repeat protein
MSCGALWDLAAIRRAFFLFGAAWKNPRQAVVTEFVSIGTSTTHPQALKRNPMNRKTRNVSPASHFESLENRQLMSAALVAGGADSTFGGGKAVQTPFGFAANRVAAQPDGKVLIVGTLHTDFAVARLNADGTPDTTFGTNGLVTTDFGGKVTDIGQQIAVQNDGKILVVGSKKDNTDNTGQWLAARYNANGSLDASFGDAGKETISGFDATGGGTDLAIQPDGKIVFTTDIGFHRGFPTKFIDFDFSVVRLNSNGQLDPTFGKTLDDGTHNGVLTTDIGNEDGASCLVIQPDGKILVGGNSGNFSDHNDYILVRYNTDGSLDTSFDSDGIVGMGGTGKSFLSSIALDTDGKIYAAGENNGQFFVARFNAAGHIDPIFNKTGMFVHLSAAGVDVADKVVIPKPGRVMLIGRVDSTGSDGGTVTTTAIQFKNNGSIDKSFGTNGVAKFEMPLFDQFGAVADDGHGKVVIAGDNFDHDDGTTAVVRFNEAAPNVSIVAGNAFASEGGSNGSVIFKRDIAYNFATTIPFQVGGSATRLADYTGLLASFSPFGKSVTIPAGATSVTVPVNIVDDKQLEPTEQVTVTGLPGTSFNYALVPPLIKRALIRKPIGVVGGIGGGLVPQNSTTIDILDNDSVHVNFQLPSNTPVGNYVADTGLVFGDRGNGLSYGWENDNTGSMRIRGSTGSPDFRYDSLALLQSAWEIAVPNGRYEVRLVAGDPNFTDSQYKLNVEGQRVLTGTPGGDVHWFRATSIVDVTDGRLTITNGSGAQNNKIAFLDIKSAPFGAQVGSVTGTLPVSLFGPATQAQWTKGADGLFSDKQIDDTTIWI